MWEHLEFEAAIEKAKQGFVAVVVPRAFERVLK